MRAALAVAVVSTLLLGPRVQADQAQAQGVGEVTFPNSGAAAAQAPFLAGLAQLHNFEYASAADLFRKAQQIDPGFAMAYWGEAMTYNHPVWMEQDLSAARKALERLGPTRDGRAAAANTPREKDYLRAVDILYGEGAKPARDLAYASAMAGLSHTYPDDPDAAAFYALALLGTAHGGRDFAIYMRAAAVVEPVFRDHPRHPGAAHYLIHSYDDPIHAPLGLRAARAYSKIAPSAGHAQHMTSHIFVALGMWDDLVSANETAVTVVDAGRASRGLVPSACGHYNFWLEYGYLQQGRFGKAKQLVADCLAAARREKPTPPLGGQVLDPDNTAAGSFAAMRLRYLLDTEDWTSDVAAWTIDSRGGLRTEIALEFGTGYAAAHSGQRAAAVSALDRLARARQALEASLAGSEAGSAQSQAREWARLLQSQLAAVIQAADGGRAEATSKVRDAATLEEGLPIEFGPPAIDKPSRELLGELLLSQGKPAEARAAFEQALTRTPERTASLRGLMRAAVESGDTHMGDELRTRLRAIWRLADQIPQEIR